MWHTSPLLRSGGVPTGGAPIWRMISTSSPMACMAPHVKVDTDSGIVKLLKHRVVEDCGRVINPQLADEQVRGGGVQGFGGALL